MAFLSKASCNLNYLRDRLAERAVRALPASTMTVTCRRPVVSFTFDDVPCTALSAGARILEEYGVRGTFYIAGGLLNQVEPDRNMISVQGCHELAEAGHELGCHTFGHEIVHTLSGRALRENLDRNGALLDTFERPVKKRNFAYPYNQGSLRHRQLIADRYQTARGGGDRINRGTVNRGFLWGMEIRQPEQDALALVWQIDEVVKNPGWLIFFTHDVSDTPTPYGCTPSTFSTLVRYAVSSNCLVLPVRDALEHVRG